MSLSTPKFYTNRLVYRASRPDDATGVLSQMQEPRTMLYGRGGRLQPRRPDTEDEFKKWEDSLMVHIIICLPKEQEPAANSTTESESEARARAPEPGIPIGHSALGKVSEATFQDRTSMFGISLVPSHQGKGYGEEALIWLFDQAFYRYGLHRIECGTWDFNQAGAKLYKKMGMTQEGRRRQCHWQEGKFRDEIQFGILDEEWYSIRNELTSEPAPGS